MIEIRSSNMEKTISSNNFSFYASNFKEINDQVQRIEWNFSKKTIKLNVDETCSFNVYKWIKHLEEQSLNEAKSPFARNENNYIAVVFQDKEGNQLEQIKLTSLTVVDHFCELRKQTIESNMSHFIELKYEKIELNQA
jgi:hypothetical protein